MTPEPDNLEKVTAADLANTHVIDFTLTEAVKHDQRAKLCACPKCVADHLDADDRVEWSMNAGNWRTKRLKVQKGNETYYIDDDGSFEKEFT